MLKFNPIQDDPRFVEIGNQRRRARIDEYRRSWEVYFVDGVAYFAKNNAVIPPSTLRDHYVEVPEGQQAARDAEVDRTIADYKKARQQFRQQNPLEYAEEQREVRAMARAAHGPGVEMVNVITGERYTT
jgi:hypothetical protein